jgi:hypothetical protein
MEDEMIKVFLGGMCFGVAFGIVSYAFAHTIKLSKKPAIEDILPGTFIRDVRLSKSVICTNVERKKGASTTAWVCVVKRD